MGYKQKSGPLQRAGYDKDAASPFKQVDETAGTRIAPGLRDEFGTLVPEGDFTSGVTVSAKMPEKSTKLVKKLQKSLIDFQPVGNDPWDRAATKLKWAKNPQPSHMVGIKDETLNQRIAGGSDKFYLKKMQIIQEDAKKHRAKQITIKL